MDTLKEDNRAKALIFADEITAQGKTFEESVLIDSLSGAYNRSFLRPFWDKAMQDARRREADAGEANVTGVLLDIDGLKELNDSGNHNDGDRAIRRLGEVINSELRPGDYFFRTGGDEFFLILVGADNLQARRIIDRIRVRCLEKEDDKVHFSAGFNTIASYTEDCEEVKTHADDDMYRHKKARKILLLLTA
jgi:diguanylate cyclase (GGDEF)-like protein